MGLTDQLLILVEAGYLNVLATKLTNNVFEYMRFEKKIKGSIVA
jgi:hypothetical protein